MAFGDKRLPVNLQRQIAGEGEIAAQRQIVLIRIAKTENADRIRGD